MKWTVSMRHSPVVKARAAVRSFMDSKLWRFAAAATVGPELDDYRALLKEGLWQPTELELFVMDRGGRSLPS